MDLADARAAIDGNTQMADEELIVVDPRELTRHWLQVRRGVETVCERASDGWLPEDCYMALKQGSSTLLVGYVAQYYVGFLVVTPQPGWTGPELHVWAAYNRGGRDVLETFLPRLVELARARGMVRITMDSARKGWERRAVQLGFEKGTTRFALEV